MKKLLLSCAVAALAIPAANAVTYEDLLGKYSGTYLGWDTFNDYEEYDGFLDEVIIEEGDYADEVYIVNMMPEIPGAMLLATFDEASQTLSIKAQNLVGAYTFSGYDWDTYEWVTVELSISDDCTITLPENIELYAWDNATNEYVYNIGELVLYQEESTGGDEPGDEPGAEPEAVDAICGVWQSNYDFWWDSTPHPQVSEDVTITKVNGNEVEISPNLIQFANGTNVFNAPIPAFYDPETNTLTIYSDDLVSDYDVYFEFANVGVPECTFLMDSDGWFSFDDGDNDYDICIDDLGTGWLDYAVYELYLEPIEVGAAGVKNVEVNDADAPVVYYDLQGRKINNPSNGLFIRKQGSKATKVIIK